MQQIKINFSAIEPCIKSLIKLSNQLNGISNQTNLEKKLKTKITKISEHMKKQLTDLKLFLVKYNENIGDINNISFESNKYKQKYEELKHYKNILEGKIETMDIMYRKLEFLDSKKTEENLKDKEIVINLKLENSEMQIELDSLNKLVKESKDFNKKMIKIAKELNILKKNEIDVTTTKQTLSELFDKIINKAKNEQKIINKTKILVTSQSITQEELINLIGEINKLNIKSTNHMFFGFQLNIPFLQQLQYILDFDFPKDFFTINYKSYIDKISKQSSITIIKLLSLFCSTFGGKSVLWYRNYVSERFYTETRYKRDKKCKILKFYYTYVNPTNENNKDDEDIKEFCAQGDLQRKNKYIEAYRQLDVEIGARSTIHYSEPPRMLSEYKPYRELYYIKSINSGLTSKQLKENADLDGS